MASNCFTPIRGRRMRVTRVDTIGRPVAGPCSTVVTSGFVNVEMTAEVEEGEETTVRTAGGTLCVSEKGADQLKWINVSIEFCNVDPDLFSMINPTWTKLLDRNGETIGWEESHEYSIDTGISLEVWSDVTGYTPTDPTAQGAWVYYLLPFVVGGTLGDITVENGAVSFTITGRTKKGSQWGKGPYSVMANPPDGAPGPLITPFSSESPRRIFLTTVRPPEPVCGCQPLSSADGPVVTLFEDTDDTTRLTVQAYASGLGPYTVDWGDGTVEDLPAGLTGKTHKYGARGTYNVAIYPSGSPSLVTYTSVTVPYTGDVPVQPLLLDVAEDVTDTARRTAEASWNNTDFGTVRVDWGDGTTGLTAQAENGTATHQYASSGQYTVTVIDESDSTRVQHRTVTIPFGLLMSTATDPLDATLRTLLVTVDNGDKGSVLINWGDGTATTTNAGDGTSVSKHKFAQNGGYTVTATDTDDATRHASKLVTVPLAPPPPTITAEEDTSDVDGMTVAARVDNHGNGSVTLDWGDGSSDSANAGDGTTVTTHAYTDEGTYTVTATDDSDSSLTATREVAVPFSGGNNLTATVAEASPPGSPRRKITVTWDNQNQGPVTITFGYSGETPTTAAVSGAMDHTYTADGIYNVTVRDSTNNTRSVTNSVTVPFTG